jgi:hypothetical protein
LKLALTLITACAIFTSIHAAEPAAQFTKPSFDVVLQLTPQAEKYLKDNKEAAEVAITFSDFYGVGSYVFGKFSYTFAKSAEISVRDLKFLPKKINGLKVQDYEVHIDVGSTRKNSKSNVLDCEYIQAQISVLQNKKHTLKCGLLQSAQKG